MSRLIITDLVVENFRKFDRPQRLTGLGPGLNLLAAPNEAGKSTLKAALDAALFQRLGLKAMEVEEPMRAVGGCSRALAKCVAAAG